MVMKEYKPFEHFLRRQNVRAYPIMMVSGDLRMLDILWWSIVASNTGDLRRLIKVNKLRI